MQDANKRYRIIIYMQDVNKRCRNSYHNKFAGPIFAYFSKNVASIVELGLYYQHSISFVEYRTYN